MRKPKQPPRRRAPEVLTNRRHWPRIIVIPDTQVKPGVPTAHLKAAGNYVAAKEPDIIVVLGDWWDMPSLSIYEDKSSAYWDSADRTFSADIAAGNLAMDLFLEPIRRRRKKGKWKPRMVFLEGNHEDRIRRAIHANPALRGIIGLDRLNLSEFEFYPFLQPVKIEGLLFCHYFVNPQSLKKQVLGGTMDNRLNKLKQSFVMGHQQTRMWGTQYTVEGKELCGLIAGAFYSHDEDYLGPQGNDYWRGIVVLNEVHGGHYDPMFVSLQYLISHYL